MKPNSADIQRYLRRNERVGRLRSFYDCGLWWYHCKRSPECSSVDPEPATKAWGLTSAFRHRPLPASPFPHVPLTSRKPKGACQTANGYAPAMGIPVANFAEITPQSVLCRIAARHLCLFCRPAMTLHHGGAEKHFVMPVQHAGNGETFTQLLGLETQPTGAPEGEGLISKSRARRIA